MEVKLVVRFDDKEVGIDWEMAQKGTSGVLAMFNLLTRVVVS